MIEKPVNTPKLPDIANKMVEKLYQLTLGNQPEIDEVKNFLNLDPPKNNLLLYFNHISYPDPVFVYWFYQKYLDPGLLRQTILPASFFHTQFTHNPAFAGFFKLGKLIYGYEDVRLVQSYMVGKKYSKEEATKSYRTLVERIKTSKEQKPTTLIIAPEGHRADDGLSLQRGDEGIVKLARMMAPVLVLPVGINYPQRRYQRSALNFGQAVNLNLGAFTILETRQDKNLNYIDLMKNLASALPEDMRGYWSDK